MLAEGLVKLALVSVAGLAIGVPFVGYFSLFSSPSTSASESITTTQERIRVPRLVLARGAGAGEELSFSYDSFFTGGGGEPINKSLPFSSVSISFNGYKLKAGDILCSPDQDGKYLVMKKKDVSSRRGLNEYTIDGHNEVKNICPRAGFFQRNPKVKSIQLNGFKGTGSFGRNASPDKIILSSCYFELKKNSADKWDIMWDKCKTNEANRNGYNNIIPKVSLTADYEPN